MLPNPTLLELHPFFKYVPLDVRGLKPAQFVQAPNPVVLMGLEKYKQLLRVGYQRQKPRSFQEALDQAAVFWRAYEQANRDYCPDDPVYSVARAGITPTAGNDLFTFVSATTNHARILEVIIGSEGTASAAARAVLQRSTGGTTGGGALTAEKFHPDAPASASMTNIFTTWSTQPTLSGNPVLAWGWNAFGGFVPWKAMPGEEYYTRNGSQTSLRNSAGTAVISVNVVYEEW